MSDISEIALAFCRECYWAQVRGATIVDRSFMCGCDTAVSMSIAGTNFLGHFDYGNVGVVIEAVRSWCEVNALGFRLEYVPPGKLADNGVWHVSINMPGHENGYGGNTLSHLPKYLMEAAVEAARKLKGTA